MVFYSVEETGRKVLRAHGVTRSANAPKTLTEAESIQNSQNQADCISRFADAILQAELLIKEPHRCCRCETILSEKVEVPARARILLF